MTTPALYRVQMTGLFEAEEPIIHTEETIGTIAKIKRIKVLSGGEPVWVPALSGNSFRGQLRDLIADHFVEMVRGDGEKIKMSPDVYGVIFSGGVMKKGSDLSAQMEQLMQAVPLLRVLGSAFGNVMLPSKIFITHLIPLTQETRAILDEPVSRLRTGNHPLIQRLQEWENSLPSADSITYEEGPLTRKDDSKNPLALEDVELTERAPNAPPQQMIYNVECIASGTMLIHRIGTKFPLTEIELGCLLDGLVAFADMPFVGGRSAAGYGRVRFVYHMSLQPLSDAPQEYWLDAAALKGLNEEGPDTLERAIGAYRRDVRARASTIRQVLGPAGNQEQSGEAREESQ